MTDLSDKTPLLEKQIYNIKKTIYETDMPDTHDFMSKIHRLMKVFYITFSIIFFIYILFDWGYENLSRYEGYDNYSSYSYKGVNLSWSLLAAILFTLLQIVFCDFLYRIGSYINIGTMKGFLKYRMVPLRGYILILGSILLFGYILFSIGEDYNNYCEKLDGERDKGQCMCGKEECSKELQEKILFQKLLE